MQIKLSDFILEHSVSDAEVSNIIFEQAVAETQVYMNICNAYLKRVMMEEYLGLADEYIDDEDDDIVIEGASEEEATSENEVVNEAADAATADATYGMSTFEPGESKSSKKDEGSVDKFDRPGSYDKKEKKKKTKREHNSDNAVILAFKAVGRFLSTAAKKLGMVNEKVVRTYKQLSRCVDEATDAEIEDVVRIAKKELGVASEKRVYQLYSFEGTNNMLVSLNSAVTDLAVEVNKFCDTIKHHHGLWSKTDKHNQLAISDMYAALVTFVDRLRDIDNETRVNISTTFDPSPTERSFRNQLRDFVVFYNRGQTKKIVKNLHWNMHVCSEEMRKLDVRYNYTSNYNKEPMELGKYPFVDDPNAWKITKPMRKAGNYVKDPAEKVGKLATFNLRDRSNNLKYTEIRRMINYLNEALASGGKQSVISRLNDFDTRYNIIYDYFNDKMIKERNKKNTENEKDSNYPL